MSPAAARRFARRSLRRMSPTPDLVTSLVRPPSPDAFYMAPQMHSRARMDAQVRSLGQLPAGHAVARPPDMVRRRSGPITAPSNVTAGATGTATWFRIVTSGNTCVVDGTVGTSGANLNLATTSISSGATVSITSLTITDGNP